MTDKGKPGRTSRSGFRMEVYCRNPADHVFVDVDAECQGKLLGNSFAAPGAIAPFHFNDCVEMAVANSVRVPGIFLAVVTSV